MLHGYNVGPVLLYYRTFLVNFLNSLLYAIIFGTFLHFKPEYGYLFTASGFSDIWGVLLMLEVFNCSE